MQDLIGSLSSAALSSLTLPVRTHTRTHTPLPPGKKKRGDKTHLIRPRFESDRQLSQRANQSNECLPNPTATNKLRTTHRRRSGKKRKATEKQVRNLFVFHLFLLFFFLFFSCSDVVDASLKYFPLFAWLFGVKSKTT